MDSIRTITREVSQPVTSPQWLNAQIREPFHEEKRV